MRPRRPAALPLAALPLVTALTVLAGLVGSFVGGLVVAGPATAVTDGHPDGTEHPYVGLMVAKDDRGYPSWSCSGTLVSPELFVTAGHCTDGADRVELWFGPGPVAVADGFRPGTPEMCDGVAEGGYPCSGEASGTPHTHPAYDPAAVHLGDLGAVVLDEPVVLAEYAALPAPDQLAGLRPGTRTTFTAVGYGQQEAYPAAAAWKDVAVAVRSVATPRLVAMAPKRYGDGVFVMSANADTGGTCFGDSGGPVLLGDSDVLAGVISFGVNSTCAGQSAAFRVDRAGALDWLHAEFGALL